MEIKNLSKLLLFSFILFSCSSDSENKQEYDFSFLINREWKRVEFNIPIQLDFNLDGISSTNMVQEFECIGNTSFILTSNNRFSYTSEGLVLTTTSLNPNAPNYTEQYSCGEDGAGSFFGTFTMINENSFRIEKDPLYNIVYGNEFVATFNFIDNQLIRTYTRRHPVSYDELNQVYNYDTITVEEIFEYE